MTTSTPFRDLLHAADLRHGTDGFTSPPKESVLRIFSPLKIRRLRPGLNPRTWVLKASTLPLDHRSRMLSKNIKTRHLALVLHVCKTWSVTLREEHRLTLSKNGVMKIFGLRRKVVLWDGRRLHDGELYDLNCRTNISPVIKSGRTLWPGHVVNWERGKMHIRFWLGDLKVRDNLEDLAVDWRIILKCIFNT